MHYAHMGKRYKIKSNSFECFVNAVFRAQKVLSGRAVSLAVIDLCGYRW